MCENYNTHTLFLNEKEYKDLTNDLTDFHELQERSSMQKALT